MSKAALSHKKAKIPVVEKELWVENRLGLHARPAAQITMLARRFEGELVLEKDGTRANAKDLLSLLALDCPQGTRLVLRSTGPQAQEAAAALFSLFASKFGEK
ncbi:MAG: HPr family phosphocarrier protein [Deltaproteobacteria bacterium]|nr:MAG: HPr family phosphocarrier protein [Deltaproteobacteria bacterium]